MIEYTDQQFLYRAVPVDYDGAAILKRIKGNTLAFNQLAPTLASGNYNANRSTIAYSNNVATVTTNGNDGFGFYRSMATVVGHTYLFTAKVKPSKVGSLRLGLDEDSAVRNRIGFSSTAEKTVSRTWTCATANSPLVCYYYNNAIASGDNYAITNLMVIDLTLMGITADQFKSYFPLSYYSYQSTLLPFKGTSIKTVGKNLLKNELSTQTVSGVTFTVNEDGSVKVNGTATATVGLDIVTDLQNGSYIFSGTDTDGRIQLRTYPENVFIKDVVGDTPYTINDSQVIMRLRVANGVNADWTVYPMVRLSSIADSTYEPYTSHTTNLPTLTYFPNGMKSAGNVYDELLPNKAITRVGMVNLGDLNWAYSTNAGHERFNVAIPDARKPLTANDKANLICAIYENSTNNETFSHVKDKTIAIGNTGQIYVYDSAYTSASAFKSAMANVYLFYELNEYVETDADAEIFYRFYQYGTEQILPVNGATPTTAPIIADIEYYNQIEGETPYRKFWLVNGNGERWDLTEKELRSFLENPQGLGFQKTIDVTRYGERAYKNTESYNFPQVTGDVLFYDSANSTRYEKYNEFVRFLMEQPIILHYMIPVSYNSLIADTYSLECEVMSLTKTESKTDRILTSNIQMNGLGFYEGDEIEINGTANTLTINNNGDFPVGFEIELRGTYKNPYFTLEQNGELYGEAKFDDNANNFSSVFVNSKDGEQNVVLKQNNSIMPNPLAYQDLSISNGSIYVTFVKLAKGESTLTIGADSYTISGYTIRYTPIYRSV